MKNCVRSLDNLSKTLEQFGAKVFRPNVFEFSNFFSSPFWMSNSKEFESVDDQDSLLSPEGSKYVQRITSQTSNI